MGAVHDPSVGRRQAACSPRDAGSRVAALDGLRGFALLGMLLWHAEVSWVRGGFARMTIFFALSGYLATMSWMRVRAREGGRGGFAAFWWRRARRLLPVSFLGIGVAIVVTATTGTAGMQARLPGDVLSVLLYVSNLRFWLSDQSYGELFGEPSMLQHYWTLSIEEQAFIVLPLVLAGLLLVCRGRTRRAALLATVLAVACVGLPLVVPHTPDAVWYSSIVRFGEFCGGVALALWTTSAAGSRTRSWPPRWLGPAGALALASLIAVMLTIPREEAWLYRGGMGLFLVPTVLCLAAAAADVGPAARVLGWSPLARLGRWTFSVYVLHWPLFWIVDRERTGLDGWQLATLRLAAAIVLGAIVHVLVERPLMARGPATAPLPGTPPALVRLDRALLGRVPRLWWRTWPAAGALLLAGCGLAVVSTVPSGGSGDEVRFDYFDDATAPADAAGGSDGSGDLPAGALDNPLGIPADELDAELVELAHVRMFEGDPGRIAIGVFGGSVATVLDGGGEPWLQQDADLALRPGASVLGCGLLTDGSRVVGRHEVTGEPILRPIDERCGLWPGTWPVVADIGALDVALVVPGVWDTLDTHVDGLGTSHIGDPDFDVVLLERLDEVRAGFRRAGVDQVQLVTTPVSGTGRDGDAWERRGLTDDHPERVARLNELLREVDRRYDDVSIVDLAAEVDGWDEALQDERMPDGVHYSQDGAHAVWEQYLADAVVRTYDDR